ncbi:MAG: DUF4492 domain-containing protein [Helicobacteraceae bacterium]|nr:DUF4492 domain-containing protein [Helicobacteraceae bacterium]
MISPLEFFKLYIDGFRNLKKYSKNLWLIIAMKIFIMFAIIKYFFFPNYLSSVADTKEEKSNYVIEQLLK